MLGTLCASVGSEKVSTLFDARCNHEVYICRCYDEFAVNPHGQENYQHSAVLG